MFIPDNFHILSTRFPEPVDLITMAKKISQSRLPTDTEVAPPEADYHHPQFVPGQRVRDLFGKPHIVAEQIGCSVYVAGQNGWFHPSKVHLAD